MSTPPQSQLPAPRAASESQVRSIPEYFIFDRPGVRILGYRLKAGSTSYERLVPQAGKLTSQVLGLDLCMESGTLRFYHGSAALLFMDERVSNSRACSVSS